ncbi:MAG: protein kinase [Polyangiaceae bacterium]|nr:protein kinase [Polyangiaceae bacterium]
MIAPGTVLHRYVVESPLGSGGMGTVYRARDTHLDRAVALKVLSDGAGGLPDQEGRARLVREARAAAALSHPNAVAIYDAGDSEHGPFIVMELVEGETLRTASSGASADDVVGWMKMAALALAEAHDRGIVHRDIKPENLMVRADGMVKVLDFGIARQGAAPQDASAPTHNVLPTLTGTGVQIGTPQYMAPEQIKGKKLDGRTDQFAWGVTIYEVLSGRSPWQAEGGALGVVAAILEEIPTELTTVRTDVPAHVSSAIARALSKRPEDRFPTMRHLVRALDGQDPDVEPEPAKPKDVKAPGMPKSPAFETRFSEATVKAVIGKALQFEQRGGYSKTDLKEAAVELGISEDAIEQAAIAIRGEREKTVADDELKRRILLKRKHGFLYHLIAYVGVNLAIIIPALFLNVGVAFPFFFIPAILWGIGLASHGVKASSDVVDPEDIREEIAEEERAVALDAAHRAAFQRNIDRKHRRHQAREERHEEHRVRIARQKTGRATERAQAEAEAEAEAWAEHEREEVRARDHRVRKP